MSSSYAQAQLRPIGSPGEAQIPTYLIYLLDPPVDAIKGPAVGNIVYQEDALKETYWSSMGKAGLGLG